MAKKTEKPKGDDKQITTIERTMTLPVEHLKEEKARMAQALADLDLKIVQKKKDAKDEAKADRDEIKGMEEERDGLARNVVGGHTQTTVKVRHYLDSNRKVLKTVRLDTNQEVKTEGQPVLDLRTEEEKKKDAKKEKAAKKDKKTADPKPGPNPKDAPPPKTDPPSRPTPAEPVFVILKDEVPGRIVKQQVSEKKWEEVKFNDIVTGMVFRIVELNGTEFVDEHGNKRFKAVDDAVPTEAGPYEVKAESMKEGK